MQSMDVYIIYIFAHHICTEKVWKDAYRESEILLDSGSHQRSKLFRLVFYAQQGDHERKGAQDDMWPEQWMGL